MNLYLGPYIRFKQTIVDHIVKVTGCPKCKCDMRSQFCANCGGKCSAFEKVKRGVKFNPMQLVNDLNIVDVFARAEVNIHDVYMPNQYIKDVDRECYIDDLESCFIDKFDEDFETRQFMLQYKEPLIKLAEAYGEPLYARWGLVAWENK